QSRSRGASKNLRPFGDSARGSICRRFRPAFRHDGSFSQSRNRSSSLARLCADQQRRGIAAHPATRLMDLGRGLDPYTTSSPIAVRGSPTLVSDLNRAINNGGPLYVKSPTLKRANPAKLGALGGACQ